MYPQRNQIVSAVYEYISEHGTIKLENLYQYVILKFDMTADEIARKDSQGGSLINHEVRWALQSLKIDGRIKRGSEIGVWTLA